VKLEVAIAAASDVGSVREHNEDSFLVGDLDAGSLVDAVEPWIKSVDRGALLVVCDGMGGVEGGEVASELAAQAIWREMKQTTATKDPEVFARLLSGKTSEVALEHARELLAAAQAPDSRRRKAG